MKLEKIPTPISTFKPITISLTIESEEEFKALRCMSQLTVTIPEAVIRALNLTDEQGNHISEFLEDFNSILIRNNG
jgi:hypothetical protein